MGITFIFILAVTLFCPVQTKPLTESPSQDPTGAAQHFNVVENVTKVKTCRSTEFSCDDKRKTCLPMIWRCDGDKDCLNGADEEDCVTQDDTSKNQTVKTEVETCEFSCDDKRKSCVPLRWRCDGDKDCLNGADEEGCVTQNEDAPVTSKNQTVKNEVKTCRSTEFSCDDKRKTCLPLRWRCDGDKDCLNGADEEDCVTQDDTSKNQTVKNEVETCEFSCDDKRKSCVPLRWRCDGDKDCLNGADEEDCDDTSKNQTVKNEVKTCRSTEFSCDDKRKTCLPLRWRCDGEKDCLNGADEEDCVTQDDTSKNQTVQK